MKRFNLDQFFWFLVVSSLSLILMFMLYNGTIFMLIDGQRKISIYFMIIFLVLISIVQATRIFTIPSRGGVRKGYIQYILLILIFALVSFIDISRLSLEIKGVKLYQKEHRHLKADVHEDSNYNIGDNIVISSSNFHQSIDKISTDIDKHLGKEVEIEGIYYNDNKVPGSFIITQINMNCCIADSDYLGILCEYSGKNLNFKTGEKIKIKGVIDDFYDGDKRLIKIKVNEIE